jgi:2-iminobutanoate/2-iminopropanoate deaminase
MMHKSIQTTAAAAPKGNYSQAVRVGTFLFVSGQLPIDLNGILIGGTIAEETFQVLHNLRAIVEAADCTIADIVQCTIYISDIRSWPDVNRVYGEFFSGVPVLPARAVVPVKQMHFGANIEIQAIACAARDEWSSTYANEGPA